MYTLKHKTRSRQVEGRLSMGSYSGTSLLAVVGLNGYDYKFYRERKRNIHIAMNGPLVLSFAEFEQFVDELKAIVADSKEILENT